MVSGAGPTGLPDRRARLEAAVLARFAREDMRVRDLFLLYIFAVGLACLAIVAFVVPLMWIFS
jgi:hypothetical protein